MKKISFLVIVTSILSACSISPQATVTPEATVTLTATPTVTFTPTPSQTPTPEPTPTPDPAQIAAEEMGKLNLVLGEDYTFATDENGNLAAFNADGVKIYEPNTHRWNSELIGPIVENMLKVTGDCEKTPFPASTDIMDDAFEDWREDLFFTRAKDAGVQPQQGLVRPFYPFRSVSGNCWGFGAVEPEHVKEMENPNDMNPASQFYYPNRKGEVQVFELFNP